MLKQICEMSALLLTMACFAAVGCSRTSTGDPLAVWLRQHHAVVSIDANLPGNPIVAVVFMGGGSVTDDDLSRIEGLTELRRLELPEGTPYAGLAKLRRLKKLECLGLEYTKVSDDGLRIVAGFDRLEELANRPFDDGCGAGASERT